MSLLSLNEVDAGYGNLKVLRNVSMSIDEGAIIGVIGSNGAGKSTLLFVLSRIIRESRGTLQFNDRPLSNYSTKDVVNEGMILVPEGRLVFPQFTVYENLIIASQNRRARSLAEDNLKKVWQLFPRLEERKRQKAGTLSGGEQQMLAVGRGLMANPRLLMLDEPSLGLAPIVAIQIYKTIKEMNGQGITVLLVEQNVKAAFSLAHIGFVLENGRILVSGNAQELLKNRDIEKHYLDLQ